VPVVVSDAVNPPASVRPTVACHGDGTPSVNTGWGPPAARSTRPGMVWCQRDEPARVVRVGVWPSRLADAGCNGLLRVERWRWWQGSPSMTSPRQVRTSRSTVAVPLFAAFRNHPCWCSTVGRSHCPGSNSAGTHGHVKGPPRYRCRHGSDAIPGRSSERVCHDRYRPPLALRTTHSEPSSGSGVSDHLWSLGTL
jgi:hypothetical protein